MAFGDAALRLSREIEDWGNTWRNPSKARVLARVPAIAMPDIAGYWPHTTRPVRGPQEYAKRIIDLLDFIPDFRAEPIEYATNGDVMFVRWIARGTGPKGRFEAVGVDRMIVPTATSRKTSSFRIIRSSRTSPDMWVIPAVSSDIGRSVYTVIDAR